MVQGVLLRRMKTMTIDGKPIIDLPDCTEKRLSAEFSPGEQAFYDELKEQSKDVVRDLKDNSGGCATSATSPTACDMKFAMNPSLFLQVACCCFACDKDSGGHERCVLSLCRDAYFNALAHLMRLRQACCHMALVKSKSSSRKPTTDELQAARSLPSETRLALLNALVTTGKALRCVHCGDLADDPVASHCSHILCKCAPVVVCLSLIHI